MQLHFTALPNPTASFYKAALVDIGLDTLSRGDWQVVAAVTALIRNRGWSHV